MSSLRARLKLEQLETREVPASPVIPLGNLGNRGVTLQNFEDEAEAGGQVSGAGDVNGDGFADVIVAAQDMPAGGTNRGEVYVLFGGPGLAGSNLVLSSLGTRGFLIRGFEDTAEAGSGARGAGDVNGDGFA